MLNGPSIASPFRGGAGGTTLVRNGDGSVSVLRLGRGWVPVITPVGDGTVTVAAPSYPASFGWRIYGGPTYTEVTMASGPATLATAYGDVIEVETYGGGAVI